MKQPAFSGRIIKYIILLTLTSLFISCVTVNVNFPEGAVQKAADNYVKDLYRAKEKVETEEKSETKKSTDEKALVLENGAYKVASLMDVLIPKAHAQINFSVSNADISEIKKRQVSRLANIDKYKKKGFIGESEEGLLVFKATKLRAIEKKRVQKIIKKENEDRENLYNEIASENNVSSAQKPQVSKSFSKSFKKISPKGTWIQADGQWSKK